MNDDGALGRVAVWVLLAVLAWAVVGACVIGAAWVIRSVT